jgi:hypothetical protein
VAQPPGRPGAGRPGRHVGVTVGVRAGVAPELRARRAAGVASPGSARAADAAAGRRPAGPAGARPGDGRAPLAGVQVRNLMQDSPADVTLSWLFLQVSTVPARDPGTSSITQTQWPQSESVPGPATCLRCSNKLFQIDCCRCYDVDIEEIQIVLIEIELLK